MEKGVKMNREYVICFFLGFIEGTKHNISATDKLITLDQTLIKFNLPPTTNEEKLNIVEELASQIDMTMMFGKINRTQARDLRNRKKIK